MNTRQTLRCKACGSAEMRWVAALNAVWDGAVLRCNVCCQQRLIPTTPVRT